MTKMIILSLIALTALAAPPKYTLKSKEILGAYEEYKSNNYGGYGEFSSAEVKFDRKNSLRVYLGGNELEISYNKGKLTFDSSIDDECDDPGCGYVTYISGQLKPKKIKGKYVPALFLKTTVSFDYPDEPDAIEGEHTFTEILVWDKQIIDEKPLALDVKIEARLQNLINSCLDARKADRSGPDFLCIQSAERKKFRQDVDFEVGNEAFLNIYSSSDRWLELSMKEVGKLIIANTKYHLMTYEVLSKAILAQLDDPTEKKKEVDLATKTYQGYRTHLDEYLTMSKNTRIYMYASSYTTLSHFNINQPTIYLVNDKYKTVTTLKFNNAI